ncbi:MAG: DUF177 domain-containing protein [Chloroflexi bacterium]|nr:DUF177 domain-containing protein [Chloroflexota bacterium]
MLYNVSQLLMEGVGASRRYSFEADLEDVNGDGGEPTHIRGDVRLVRTPKGVLATGKARFQAEQVCRRCLEPSASEAVFEFEEEFIPSIDILTGAALPITDEDEPELIIDAHHTLNLRPVLWQSAVATSGGMGLCRPDCKGLCPHCGQNLNEGPCTCDLRRVDPRLAALAELLGPADET